MAWHYFIIGLLIAIIIVVQVYIYARTRSKLSSFKNIFPSNASEVWTISKQNGVQIIIKQLEESMKTSQLYDSQKQEIEEELSNLKKKIQLLGERQIIAETEDELTAIAEDLKECHSRQNKLQKARTELNASIKINKERINSIVAECSSSKTTRVTIINSINNYLEKNKNAVTDFNLIKDIIDRNSDALEEDIQTQIPIPLYFGLMGTMFGILVGVLALVFSDALTNLLSTFQPDPSATEYANALAKQAFDETATSGVSALFGGVALAMISSIVGIILTTLGSLETKTIKYEVEKRKHAFLSWLQAELLPKISSDFSAAVIKLGHDLTGFNSTFSTNAQQLNQAMERINSATINHAKLLETIERLNVDKIARANIDVYENLKNCMVEIRNLSVDMKSIQESIRGVGQFMEDGINEYENRNTFIQDASGKVDLAIQQGQQCLSQSAMDLMSRYNELLNNLYLRTEANTQEIAKKYDIETQKLHEAIVTKLSDVKRLEDELKNLVAVKTSMANLEHATSEQNRRLSDLTQEIRNLAQLKATGGTATTVMQFPRAYKVIMIAAGSVLTATCLFFIVLRLLSMFGIG